MSKRIRKCSIDGCNNKHVARGLCGKHYQRAREKFADKCKTSGCMKHTVARGYCNKHYRQLRKNGELQVLPPSDRQCSVEGCLLEHKAKDLCQIHYDRWRDQGRFEAYQVYYKTPEESFTARAKPTNNGCIEWTGAISTEGYGLISVNRKSTYAHRYAWERVNGPIREEMVLDHKCFNRRCVNVDHIRVTTQRRNAQHLRYGRTNNTSGYRGVSWSNRNNGYLALVRSKGDTHYLGTFEDPEEAAIAALRKRQELGFPDSLDDLMLLSRYMEKIGI